MPHEPAPSWSAVRDAFAKSVELPEIERTPYLEANFPPNVVAEVASLLAHHSASTQFLSPPDPVVVDENQDASGDVSLEGQVFAERYDVGPLIGEGGTSVVHRCEDKLTGDISVIKVISSEHRQRYDLVRTEATALRLLDLPGVVRLLDEGEHEGQSFLVVGFIEGRIFPGWINSVPSDEAQKSNRRERFHWPGLRQPTLGLLEVLARVHHAGIVHADLKPGNVLVRRNGAPVILDLGISRDPGADTGTRKKIALAGTPRYLSPEQLDGKPASPVSDLYAVGIMLYEALSGRDPHDARTALDVIVLRPNMAPPPLLDVAPNTPPHVATVVDSLITADPTLRPQSAGQVIRALQVGQVEVFDERRPFLGSTKIVDALVSAARESRSLDIMGLPRSGRTRCLLECELQLASEGIQVGRTSAGTRPFESLNSLGIDAKQSSARTQESAHAWVITRLRELLEDRHVILVDDANSIDSMSFRVLQAARHLGPVLRAFPDGREDAMRIPPLEADDLRVVFHGHERLLHIPSDAAHQLWARSGGRPGRVIDELASWERAGLSMWDDNRVRIKRDAIDRLRSGLRVHQSSEKALLRSQARGSKLDTDQRMLVTCIDLLGRHATADRIASVLEIPAWELVPQIDAFVREGILEATQVGGYFSQIPTHGGALLSTKRREDIHRRIADALPKNEPKRLQHLLLANDLKRAPSEALALALELASEGNDSLAWGALREGLWAAHRVGDKPTTEALLDELTIRSLVLGSSAAMRIALYELGRIKEPGKTIQRLERVVRAALLGMERDSKRAMALLPRTPDHLSATTARSIMSVWLFQVRRLPIDAWRAELRRARMWAETHHSRVCLPMITSSRGWMAYKIHDYEEAAKHQLLAASMSSQPTPQATYKLNAASALLESGDYDQAIALSTQMHAYALPKRMPRMEARAEGIIRAAHYRRGEELVPDLEFVAACHEATSEHAAANIVVVEAAIAWRRGDLELGRQLAKVAAEGWTRAQNQDGAMLAKALAVACGASLNEAEGLKALENVSRSHEHHSATQAAYLYGLGLASMAELFSAQASIHAQHVPKTRWPLRGEITSISESVK